MTGERISILFLMQNLNIGGAERVGLNIINHLDRTKFSAELLVIGNNQGALEKELPNNLKATYLSRRRAVFAIFPLLKKIWSQKPDIVFVNLSHLNLLLSMFRWLLPREVRLIARETTIVSLNNQNYRFSFVWNLLYKIFYRQLDHVICQSSQMRLDLVQKYGLPFRKASIIQNPTDIERIRRSVKNKNKPKFKGSKLMLVSVGTLDRRKNFDGLLRAMSLHGNSDIFLNIVGDGPERQRLESLIEELDLFDRVAMLGHQDDPYPLIFEADALILTSIYEGLPNVILEALALQTPVISTPAGGVCRDLLHDRLGCVVAKDHTDASIADAILRWSIDAPYQIDRSAVEAFDTPAIVKRYENQFKSLHK